MLNGGVSTTTPYYLWALPFVGLIGSIAVFPLVPRLREWWDQHHHKLLFGIGLSVVVLLYYGLRGYGVDLGEGARSAPGLSTAVAVGRRAILEDYIPFITLLLSLYVVSGGLQIRGNLVATPAVNAGFLGVGALLASVIGTTGASMLLIRPLLHSNHERKHVQHTVVFFIFLVSNIGGSLLPLGDPPLFLGYLRGLPFLWPTRLIVPWMFCVSSLLLVYLIWDTLAQRREQTIDLMRDIRHRTPLRLHGGINFLWLLGIVLSVALIVPGQPFPGTGWIVGDYVRETVMLGLAGLSLATTPRGLRRDAGFSYGAIAEVACLFLGIFLTMSVPIEILRSQGPAMGLSKPVQFFWASGGLSSVLDNAPTYLVFFETARAIPDHGPNVVRLLSGATISADLLVAISLGSVFMGANTYIGNGPNFLVKSIAEQSGVRMPSFFGYIAYSVAILIPLFIAVSLLFLHA